MKTLSILSTKLSAWGLHLIGRGGSMPGSIGCKVDANILTKLKIQWSCDSCDGYQWENEYSQYDYRLV